LLCDVLWLRTPNTIWFLDVYGVYDGLWMFMVDSFGRPHLVGGIDPPFIAKD